MFGIDAISSYLLVVALVTLLLAVLIWQTHRTGRTVIVWLAAGLLGMILGSIGSYAALRAKGYMVVEAPTMPVADAPASPPGGMPGMGMMPGGMGGMGMMLGGMGAPQPQRELASLVRKLDLLTGDIAVTLTTQQAAAVSECLKDVEKSPTMSGDEAKQRHEKLFAVFSDEQKKRFSAIELPRRGGPGGPGGPGMGGGMMGMGGGMGGGPKREPDQNPFHQEPVAEALKSLRQKLATRATAAQAKPDTSAPKPPAADSSPPPAPSKPGEKAPEKP